ncbi:MAG: dTDP-4-dehydrorhamnose reductase [Flammeovirgaceae bacterium]
MPNANIQTKILITGGKGQLGQCIKTVLENTKPSLSAIWVDADEMDISSKTSVESFFKKHPDISHCINAAAYTAVDKAEEEEDLAYKVNVLGVENLVEFCQKLDIQLIHISTDFVFGGKNHKAYKEDEQIFPLNIYGKTKSDGEEVVLDNLPSGIVVRTSWLYSQFGKNFVKTMIRLGKEKGNLGVVADQIGTPTYGEDLANFLLKIVEKTIDKAHKLGGVYHFSNEGVASWYDFAHAIFDIYGISVQLRPLKTQEYPTPAQRPHFSVLDKSKAKETFGIEIRHWRDALTDCIKKLKNLEE